MKTSEIMEDIKNKIKTGVWKRGDKIPSETDLANHYSTSRNTIRSIIQKLVAIDMLVVKHGEGTFVNSNIYDYIVDFFLPSISLNDQEFIDVLEFCKEVEVEFVKLAISNRDEDDLRQMRECLNNIEKYSHDPIKSIEADLEFHICIAKATKNEIYNRMYSKLKDLLINTFNKDPMTFFLEAEKHEVYEKLYKAILNRNCRIARSCMKSIMEAYILAAKHKIDSKVVV